MDLKKLIPYAIEGWVHVLGEEHRAMITERLNRMVLVSYYDVDALEKCLFFWKRCKKREFSVLFLEQIGEDVGPYKKDSYTVSLDPYIDELVQIYIGDYYVGIDKQMVDSIVPLYGFDSDNTGCSLESKLRLINYLRGSGVDPITEESFDRFCQTEEYELLLHRIQEIRSIYDGVVAQYMEWEKQLEPYEKYVSFEEERKNLIVEKKKEEIWQKVYSELSLETRDSIHDKPVDKQKKLILETLDHYTTPIEDFSSDQFQQLSSLNDIDACSRIVRYQYFYLKDVGAKIVDEVTCEMLDEAKKGNLQPYFKWIASEDIKKYVPSCELADYVRDARKNLPKDAWEEWCRTRADFKNVVELLGINDKASKAILERFYNKSVVMLHGAASDRKTGEHIPMVFYTFRDFGYLLFDFLHECGHALGVGFKTGGLEPFSCDERRDMKNPYLDNKRKYERMNETITDMFTMLVLEWFQSQDFYFMESKEFTFLDCSNHNTFSIVKDLLKPLLIQYRKYLCDSYVWGGFEYFGQCIGEDNFEELVDVINKSDYLFQTQFDKYFETQYKGNLESLEVNKIIEDYFRQGILNPGIYSQDLALLEYMEQLKKVEGIYQRIDQYQVRNFGNDLAISEDVSRMRR